MEDTRDVRGVAGEPSEDGAVFAAQADADVAVEQAVAVAVLGDEPRRTGSDSLLTVAAIPNQTTAPPHDTPTPRYRQNGKTSGRERVRHDVKISEGRLTSK